MRVVGEVNKYVSDSEPWKLKGDDERERLGTILHVVAQCVADLNLVLSPFLPFSANAVDLALGGTGAIAPMPRLEEVDDLDGGAGYPVITGDYTSRAAVAPAPGRARHPRRQADAGLHQARPVGRPGGARPPRHAAPARSHPTPRRRGGRRPRRRAPATR